MPGDTGNAACLPAGEPAVTRALYPRLVRQHCAIDRSARRWSTPRRAALRDPMAERVGHQVSLVADHRRNAHGHRPQARRAERRVPCRNTRRLWADRLRPEQPHLACTRMLAGDGHGRGPVTDVCHACKDDWLLARQDPSSKTHTIETTSATTRSRLPNPCPGYLPSLRNDHRRQLMCALSWPNSGPMRRVSSHDWSWLANWHHPDQVTPSDGTQSPAQPGRRANCWRGAGPGAAPVPGVRRHTTRRLWRLQ